jgi:hypothetical protein
MVLRAEDRWGLRHNPRPIRVAKGQRREFSYTGPVYALLEVNRRTRYTMLRARTPEAMKIGSLALTVVALSAGPLAYGITPAFATDFCVELTATEFSHRVERRGDGNACAGSHSSNFKDIARDRARDNAKNAIASQCLNNITPSIGQQACNRVNLIANTSTNNSWVNSPPAPKPNANEVKYIGRGIGSVDGVNLCTMAHDLRLRTRNVVDGHCSHDIGLLPHRTFVTARAWARCAVICRTP